MKLIRAAAAEAANHQERFAATDTEARKIVDIMEDYLRVKGRVVYGGAAINAHMPADKKFYDPAVNLPDYDFLTPDPLQDCADLIVSFQEEGFTDVEAKFGIHEGTYKVFVNFRAAADITFMPADLYGRLASDAVLIDGIRYASPDYLRMNMYLELSHPAGDVSRWEKVYKRLLLLNETHPLRAGRCVADPLASLGAPSSTPDSKEKTATQLLYNKIVSAGIAANAVFLSGASYLASEPVSPDPADPVLLLATDPSALKASLPTTLKSTIHPAMGELLPARIELRTAKGRLAAVIFETTACHAYITLPTPEGYRIASLDLLIQMYYALDFANLKHYIPTRIPCVIQSLIEIESENRRAAAIGKETIPVHDVFPLDCIGHQPTLPELKKAHRNRVRAKREELAGVKHVGTSLRTTKRRKKSTMEKSS